MDEDKVAAALSKIAERMFVSALAPEKFQCDNGAEALVLIAIQIGRVADALESVALAMRGKV